ncbi:hypothetical protein LXL04_014378 [Taraxacum kok-saghyz]
MGRIEENPVPHHASDQTPSQPPPPPPPQGYTNHHDNPLSSPAQPVPQAAYMGHNDQHMNHPQSTRSYVHQSPENLPPPEAYPPQKPQTYPPQQTPETYPPAAHSPHPGPVSFPPQQQPATYPPQTPESYPSPLHQPPVGNYNPQINYNAQPQPQPQAVVMNYGGTQNGVPIGVQCQGTQGWTTGILDCLDDPENAILTLCFPFVTFGQIAEIIDNGQTSCATNGLIYGLVAAFIGIPCIISCSYRTKLRSRYGLMETAPDWALHFFCEYCALCQEYRELKARGMDPAIGWQGNLSKNQQMANYAMMTPPMNQTMRG